MTYALLIYCCINCFLAGHSLAKYEIWTNSKREWIVNIFWLILIFLFGIIIVLIEFLWMGVKKAWNALDGYFQISFWFTWRFSKKWYSLSKEQLAQINRISTNRHNSKSLKDRIYRRCTEMINKRNNYTYVVDSNH